VADSKGGGAAAPPIINWMHLKTSGNFTPKCMISCIIFLKKLSAEGGIAPSPDTTTHLSAPYSKLLDPPLVGTERKSSQPGMCTLLVLYVGSANQTWT